MEEYWAQLETKVRKLILDLVEPTIRRVADHTDVLEEHRKAADQLKRAVEITEITLDRTNSKLGIIEEFSKRLVQLDADLRVSEVSADRERAKLKDELDLVTSRVYSSEQHISILQGETENIGTGLNLCIKDSNEARTTLNDQISVLKAEVDSNFKANVERAKLIDVAIYNVDKKTSALSQSLQETDLIAKQAQIDSKNALEMLQELTISYEKFKSEAKDQIDKIRFLAVQYNHQATKQINAVKEQVLLESPIQNHFQIADFLYKTFPDIRTRKIIAEIESEIYPALENLKFSADVQQKIEESKVKTQEIKEKPIPKTPKKKKSKISLKDMLNLDRKIKSQEEKVKSLEEKIISEGDKSRNSVVEITKYYRDEARGNYEDDDDSDKSSLNLETLQQNSEALAKIMGVKDYSRDIEELKFSIESNSLEFRAYIESSKELHNLLEEKIENIYETIAKIQEQQTLFQSQFLATDSQINDIYKILDAQIEKQANDLAETKDLMEKNKNSLQENIESVNTDFKKYVEKTARTIDTIEFQVNQAVNEVNSASSQRKRDHNDNYLEFQKLNNIADSILKQQEKFSKNFESIFKSISTLTEIEKINICLQFQDEIDRESIALYGYKDTKIQSKIKTGLLNKTSISLDKQCISCSGQVNLITSAFKVACLAYTPSPVLFKDVAYQRFELLDLQKKIIEGVGDKDIPHNTSFERIRLSKTPKPYWRPPSSLSMCIPSALANTPDLPPISLSKRMNNY